MFTGDTSKSESIHIVTIVTPISPKNSSKLGQSSKRILLNAMTDHETHDHTSQTIRRVVVASMFGLVHMTYQSRASERLSQGGF
jgi:hypothetical protein